MSGSSKIHLLTLVAAGVFAISSSAAPHLDSPMGADQKETSEADAPPPKAETLENISVSKELPAQTPEAAEPGAKKYDPDNYFHVYRHELNFHFGFVNGVRDSSEDGNRNNLLLGFKYLLPSLFSPKWEVAADLSLVGHGHAQLSRRHIFKERDPVRPYYSYGLLHKFVPDERFASLSNHENYLGRAALGVAFLDADPRSTEIELAAAVGTEDVLVMFTFGYSWGF